MFALAIRKKESPVLFRGRSSIDQRNFYISFLVAFPLPAQNISIALSDYYPIAFMFGQVLGKSLLLDQELSATFQPDHRDLMSRSSYSFHSFFISGL